VLRRTLNLWWGDDVLAYTNLWEWDNWLWDIRQCFELKILDTSLRVEAIIGSGKEEKSPS